MFNKKAHTLRLRSFQRGLTISPFQIPIMVWLLIQGILIMFRIPILAERFDVPEWSLWNFCAALVVGAGVAVFSRFNENERLEAIGLCLMMLAIFIILVLSISVGRYDLGQVTAIGLGCAFRLHVLVKSRKAQAVATEIVAEQQNENGETP